MIKNTNHALNHYQFSNMKIFPRLVHGVFTRHGGVSRGPYESLNVSFHVEDHSSAVQQNHQRIVETMGLPQWQTLHQTHSCTVHVIDTVSTTPLTGDALITHQPNILLIVKTADCQPVLLFDSKKCIVAAIHSGWRGSVQNIIGTTIERMIATGSDPNHIFAGIGPSLGPCCGEFVNYQQELPEYMWSYAVKPNYFDFWEISKKQMHDAGVPENNIEISNVCTKCQSDLFFSYRRKKVSGRFATVIGICP